MGHFQIFSVMPASFLRGLRLAGLMALWLFVACGTANVAKADPSLSAVQSAIRDIRDQVWQRILAEPQQQARVVSGTARTKCCGQGGS